MAKAAKNDNIDSAGQTLVIRDFPGFRAPVIESGPLLLGLLAIAGTASHLHGGLTSQAALVLTLVCLPLALVLGHTANHKNLVMFPGGASLAASAVSHAVNHDLAAAAVVSLLLAYLLVWQGLHRFAPRPSAAKKRTSTKSGRGA